MLVNTPQQYVYCRENFFLATVTLLLQSRY